MAANFTSTIPANTLTDLECNSAMGLQRSKLALETKRFNVPLEDLRIWDSATNAVLPNTPASDDLGLDLGTFGTSGFTIQSNDFGGTSATQYARGRFWLPAEYEAGGTISLVLYGGMLTTVADTSASWDVNLYAKDEADGTHGSDLISTSADTSKNSTTLGTMSFTVDPTGLTNGDELSFKLTFAGVDSGDLGVMRGILTKIYFNLQVRG